VDLKTRDDGGERWGRNIQGDIPDVEVEKHGSVVVPGGRGMRAGAKRIIRGLDRLLDSAIRFAPLSSPAFQVGTSGKESSSQESSWSGALTVRMLLNVVFFVDNTFPQIFTFPANPR
jgi:hypothetical protein